MKLSDTFGELERVCCVWSSGWVAAAGEGGEAQGQISEGLLCHTREFNLHYITGHGEWHGRF